MVNYDLIVIDSGFSLNNVNITCMVQSDETWVITKERKDVNGHGTHVLDNFLRDENKFKICLFQLGKEEIKAVLSAMNYIKNNIHCKLIQLSLGVMAYDSDLENICNELSNRGIILVASFNNNNAISYPAAFKSVIGVASSPYIKNEDYFDVLKGGIVDVVAKECLHTRNQKTVFGSSFSSSFVSKCLLNADKLNSKAEALQYLSQINYRKNNNTYAIFPLNKENYNLLYNYDLLHNCTITKVYDTKFSGKISSVIKSFNGEAEFNVENIEQCDWNAFDNIVIGHVREMSNILYRNYKVYLLDKCLKYRKNVFCYDNIDIEQYIPKFKEKGLLLKYPVFPELQNNLGKLYQHKTPIIAVFGTSKKQGKFTLQTQIIRCLKNKGYNVGWMGTEPNSELLGANSSITMGYDSQINLLNSKKIIESVNNCMHSVDILNKDIIITGAQSSFIPYYCNNSAQININNISFLYGVMPDACVLVINYYDSIEFIKRNISAIESIAGCKVLFLALNPFDSRNNFVIQDRRIPIDDFEKEKFMQNLSGEICLPITTVGDLKYNEDIYQIIIDYFSVKRND